MYQTAGNTSDGLLLGKCSNCSTPLSNVVIFSKTKKKYNGLTSWLGLAVSTKLGTTNINIFPVWHAEQLYCCLLKGLSHQLLSSRAEPVLSSNSILFSLSTKILWVSVWMGHIPSKRTPVWGSSASSFLIKEATETVQILSMDRTHNETGYETD